MEKYNSDTRAMIENVFRIFTEGFGEFVKQIIKTKLCRNDLDWQKALYENIENFKKSDHEARETFISIKGKKKVDINSSFRDCKFVIDTYSIIILRQYHQFGITKNDRLDGMLTAIISYRNQFAHDYLSKRTDLYCLVSLCSGVLKLIDVDNTHESDSIIQIKCDYNFSDSIEKIETIDKFSIFLLHDYGKISNKTKIKRYSVLFIRFPMMFIMISIFFLALGFALYHFFFNNILLNYKNIPFLTFSNPVLSCPLSMSDSSNDHQLGFPRPRDSMDKPCICDETALEKAFLDACILERSREIMQYDFSKIPVSVNIIIKAIQPFNCFFSQPSTNSAPPPPDIPPSMVPPASSDQIMDSAP